MSPQEEGYMCVAHGGPWQAWSLAEASSKRLQGKEKIAGPVAKFAQSNILLQAAGLLRLVNSQQLWVGLKQMGLTLQTQNEEWEGAGLGAGWGSDTDHV